MVEVPKGLESYPCIFTSPDVMLHKSYEWWTKSFSRLLSRERLSVYFLFCSQKAVRDIPYWPSVIMVLADRMQELSNYDKIVYIFDHRVLKKHFPGHTIQIFDVNSAAGSTDVLPAACGATVDTSVDIRIKAFRERKLHYSFHEWDYATIERHPHFQLFKIYLMFPSNLLLIVIYGNRGGMDLIQHGRAVC